MDRCQPQNIRVRVVNGTRVFKHIQRLLFHQVMFEGEHGGRHPFGDIAIDDVSFSPECRPTRHGRLMSYPSFMS